MKIFPRWNAWAAPRFFALRGRRKRGGGCALHLTALLALASPAALRADSVQVLPVAPGAEVLIKVTSPTASIPRFGFAPLRVTIVNTGPERTWRGAFQMGARQQFPGLSTTTREFVVPAGQTRETWVFVPIAEPSINAGNVIMGGPAAAGSGGITYANVDIQKTSTGTKITRVVVGSSGTPFGTEVIELNATTGERTMTMTSSVVGGTNSTNHSTPPPGVNVTYVIDPITGTVTNRYAGSPTAGTVALGVAAPRPTKVEIITSNIPATGSSRPGVGGAPKVTVTQTPVGTKVSITRGNGPNAFIQEQEIDSTTGAMTTTYVMPPGRTGPLPTTRSPVSPGTEATFTIDQTIGTVRTSMRPLPDRTAPPKIIIITAPQGGSIAGATIVSSSGTLTTPVVVGGTNYSSGIQVEFAGPGVLNNNRLSFGSAVNLSMRPFAVSASLEPVVRSQLGAVVRGAPNLSVIEAAQLPADWRVWSSFAAVLMTTDEFASLDAGRRAALRGRIGLGGRLWLSPANAGSERVEKFGIGQITTLADPMAGEAGEKTAAAVAGRPGAPIEQRTIDFWVGKVEIYNATPGLPNANDLILEKTPIGESVQERPSNNTWLAVFLVAFAAIIGPVNLFVFAPAAKRYRLFLTTPLLALVAAVILGLTIVLQDGLGGEGARRALVVLLPGDNQAAVFQEQASVTGFLTRRTFALGDDAQLAVLMLDAPDPGMGGMMLGNNADLARNDGRGGGDWFRSRGRQAQLVQRLVPTRGRIERAGTAPDGAPIVQSSLGTTLREFVVVDDLGKFWTAADLPPGKRVALTRGTSVVGTLAGGGSRRFAAVIEAATPKTAGHWRAHGGATDLAPIATLETVRWTEADVLFAGMLEMGAPESKAEVKP